jgi:ribokinase
MMTDDTGMLDVIGFGSLNIDEFWEVPGDFLREFELEPGREYVKDIIWFTDVCPVLLERGVNRASDPGGSAANTIAALKRMGFRTGFYGAAGTEDCGLLRQEELGAPEDLRIAYVDRPSGRCLALIDEDDPGRDRALVILSNANDLAGAGSPALAYFERARLIHMTSFVSDSPLRAQIEFLEGLQPEVRLSFDPGAIYSALGLGALEPLVRRTEILFCTEEELSALTGKPGTERSLERVFAMGATTVVLKQGSRGLTLFRPGGSIFQPALPARVVRDRTGAGDVAAAGFLAGVLTAADERKSLEIAAAAAARSIEGYGRSTYPDREFLDALIAPGAP